MVKRLLLTIIFFAILKTDLIISNEAGDRKFLSISIDESADIIENDNTLDNISTNSPSDRTVIQNTDTDDCRDCRKCLGFFCCFGAIIVGLFGGASIYNKLKND